MPELPLASHARALLQHARRLHRLHKASSHGCDGQNFNLFHLLGIGHLEVSTHSPILRELLDPHGSHGQGAIFLERFVARLGLPPFDFEKAEVIPETGIGPRTDTSGGRLDLAISDGTRKVMIIENKIFAGEQDNWVTRYVNYAPGATLVFLTLDGREPTNVPPGVKRQNLVCASYESHITDWLRICRKEAATAPLVRESLSQYLHLVQELTHQNRSPFMNEELVKAATEDEQTLKAYFALRNVEREVQASIVRHMEQELSLIAQEIGFSFRGAPNSEYSEKWRGFQFSKAALDPLRIGFEFDKSGYRDFTFGFVDDGKLPKEHREHLKSLFAEAYGATFDSPTWPAYAYWSRYQNWSDGDVFAEIRFGRFLSDVKAVLINLDSIASHFRRKEATLSN